MYRPNGVCGHQGHELGCEQLRKKDLLLFNRLVEMELRLSSDKFFLNEHRDLPASNLKVEGWRPKRMMPLQRMAIEPCIDTYGFLARSVHCSFAFGLPNRYEIQGTI